MNYLHVILAFTFVFPGILASPHGRLLLSPSGDETDRARILFSRAIARRSAYLEDQSWNSAPVIYMREASPLAQPEPIPRGGGGKSSGKSSSKGSGGNKNKGGEKAAKHAESRASDRSHHEAGGRGATHDRPNFGERIAGATKAVVSGAKTVASHGSTISKAIEGASKVVEMANTIGGWLSRRSIDEDGNLVHWIRTDDGHVFEIRSLQDDETSYEWE